MSLTRRTLLATGFFGAAAAMTRPASAQNSQTGPVQTEPVQKSHGLSLFGDLKYPAGFRAFDYVRADAPKGGVFSRQIFSTVYNQAFETFDSLHIFILKGNGAAGMENCFASLMARAYDEPDAMYGLVASGVSASEGGLVYDFTLRPGLTFDDGSVLDAEDCAWSLMTLSQKGHPHISEPLRGMVEATATGPLELRVRLKPERSRSLPLLIASLPVFSKKWWSGRDFAQSSLEVPPGSGPYRVADVRAGQSIRFERVKDWWGWQVPCMAGQHNFDTLIYEYYRDPAAGFLGFKARNFLFREENSSASWARGYDFPAARDGRVRRETVPDHTPSGAQGWFFNTRRSKFADPRVRQALGMTLDFEWLNRNLMFSSYRRTTSMFENSPLRAEGLPSPEELAVLETFRGKVPDAVFGPAVLPPVSDGSGSDRALLREALQLLAQAGWHIENRVLRNARGEAFTIEFLDASDLLLSHTTAMINTMRRLGIEVSHRIVDAAQYQIRTDRFDYDIISRRTTMDVSPGEELYSHFSARAAAIPGSFNAAGIADPVVDALIGQIVIADSRARLTVLCRVLDRVLRAGFYWIPAWYRAERWLAYWDVFEHADPGVIYESGEPELWWAKT